MAVDPVTDDPSTTLMSGPVVTTSAQRLATGGRNVSGLAADGVTQLVVRVPTANVGDQVTLSLFNDQQDLSSSPDDDGGLGQIGGSAFTQNQISVTSQSTGSGPFAFAIYQAPVDFARANSGDASSSQRAVYMHIQDQTQGGTPTTLPIAILRPPVVMIHGLWDNWRTWNTFGPLVTGPSTVDSRFSIGRVSYDWLVGPSIAATNPPYLLPLSLQGRIRANSMGFSYTTHYVLAQTSQWITNFKSGQNPLGAPVAAVQADVVAHSMGGLLTRNMVLQPTFFSDSTFGQGYIHKVITVDTPHLGSQVALKLMSPQENGGCLQGVLAFKDNFSLITTTFSDGSVFSGATADLGGDDTQNLTSPAIHQLTTSSPKPLPTALIAGIYQNWAALDSLGIATGIRLFCSTDSLAQQLTSTAWPTIFYGNYNDGIVSENSQLDGLNPELNAQFFGYVHSPGTEKLGFSGPSVLDAGSVPQQVIFLLNTPLNNTQYYNQIGP